MQTVMKAKTQANETHTTSANTAPCIACRAIGSVALQSTVRCLRRDVERLHQRAGAAACRARAIAAPFADAIHSIG